MSEREFLKLCTTLCRGSNVFDKEVTRGFWTVWNRATVESFENLFHRIPILGLKLPGLQNKVMIQHVSPGRNEI